MRHTHPMAPVAVAVTLVLGLAGCGGDDGQPSADAQRYIDAMTVANTADPDSPVTQEESDCLGVVIMDTVDVERFEEAGVEPSAIEGDPDFDLATLGVEVDREETEELATGLLGCPGALDGLTEQIAAQQELGPEDTACIEDHADDSSVSRLLAAAIVGHELSDSDYAAFWVGIAGSCPGVADVMGVAP